MSSRVPTEQGVLLVASVPLTDERGWEAMREGELVAVRDGVIVARQVAPAKAELAAFS